MQKIRLFIMFLRFILRDISYAHNLTAKYAYL